MREEFDGILTELKDRQEIMRCMTTYCRGVDRMDRELILSCYHPDAIDDHGAVVGDPEKFTDWVLEFVGKDISWSHYITNHSCDIDGDVAHTETYFIGVTMRRTEPRLVMAGGRYIDRLERREGKWAIVARKVLKDWWGQPGDSALTGVSSDLTSRGTPPARDRSDPSYHRPLVVSA